MDLECQAYAVSLGIIAEESTEICYPPPFDGVLRLLAGGIDNNKPGAQLLKRRSTLVLTRKLSIVTGRNGTNRSINWECLGQ